MYVCVHTLTVVWEVILLGNNEILVVLLKFRVVI